MFALVPHSSLPLLQSFLERHFIRIGNPLTVWRAKPQNHWTLFGYLLGGTTVWRCSRGKGKNRMKVGVGYRLCHLNQFSDFCLAMLAFYSFYSEIICSFPFPQNCQQSVFYKNAFHNAFGNWVQATRLNGWFITSDMLLFGVWWMLMALRRTGGMQRHAAHFRVSWSKFLKLAVTEAFLLKEGYSESLGMACIFWQMSIG